MGTRKETFGGSTMRRNSENERFPIVKRGYDPTAVDAHLEEIAAQTDATLDEAAQQIVALEHRIEELQRNEEAVQLTILAATETKEKMLAVAKQQADAMREEGRKAGGSIITEARKQAFQVVTEARTEAEGIVAAAVAEAAEVAANAVALEVPMLDGPSDRERELEAQVELMQAVIDTLEEQLHAAPAASEPHVHQPESVDEVVEEEEEAGHDDGTAEPDGALESEHIDEVADPADDLPAGDDAHRSIDVHDDESDGNAPTSPATAHDEPSANDADEAAGIRRSFYSRRSAKLPRIGVDGGRGAMAAVAGLRPHMRPGDGVDDAGSGTTPAPDDEHELETV